MVTAFCVRDSLNVTFDCSELGVLTWTGIETEGFENNEFLNKIKAVRGYNFEVKIRCLRRGSRGL